MCQIREKDLFNYATTLNGCCVLFWLVIPYFLPWGQKAELINRSLTPPCVAYNSATNVVYVYMWGMRLELPTSAWGEKEWKTYFSKGEKIYLGPS